MIKWYHISPTAPVSISNFAPVGQNSGQVACRWPPNGHHLAACLQLPQSCQLFGPFWHRQRSVFMPLPLPVYKLVNNNDKFFYRQYYNDSIQGWEIQPEHQGQDIEVVGGRYLITDSSLRDLWQRGKVSNTGTNISTLPWHTLTLSHNRRENFEVVDEGGFFAEMTTLLAPSWSMVVGIKGNYQPPEMGTLGAGGTPVVIRSYTYSGDWLTAECPDADGAVLLTGALWTDYHQQGQQERLSLPYPSVALRGFAGDFGQPWQTWKTVKDRSDFRKRVRVLTPGEWLTPAGAVYLWSGQSPTKCSGPYPDPWHRDALGYGHLWLFKENTIHG